MGNAGVVRVDPAHAGRRIDRLLKVVRTDLPYARIQRLFREKAVLLNGKPAVADQRVCVGDEIMIRAGASLEKVPANPSIHIDVLHEDDAVLVVSKPAGLPVLPGKKQKTRTLINGLLQRYGRELRELGEKQSYGLTHRLDLATSGALVVARTSEAHRHLLEQFRRREVQKEYRALVAGQPPRREYTIELPLRRIQRKGRSLVQVAPGSEGKKAVTRYQVLEVFDPCTLLDVRPLTGRTHQIRVHLAALGTPVLGDEVYGISSANEHARRHVGLERMFLHASRIVVSHPTTGESLEVEAPLPTELGAVLDRLRTRAVD